MYDPSLMAPVNVGGMVAQGLKEGQKTREQALAQGAMAALVQNPNNPRALAALAQVDPEAAMQFRQQQAQQAHEQLAQHQDSIIKGAEIIRQFNPKDQASYTAALQAAQEAGIDVSQVPQQYIPQYVDGVVKLADALKPQASDELTNYMQKGGIDPNGPRGKAMYGAAATNRVDPQQPIQTANPDGTITVNWVRPPMPSMGQPAAGGSIPITATDAHGNKVQYNAQNGQWEPVHGGATASSPSPTFP